mmetsp:Transcript_74500/g.197886  ORF Transcript_74500/g.197886 Transcript_74500/m.197886 type:complete len:345 (+) Transcript_74500:950-1984(+)
MATGCRGSTGSGGFRAAEAVTRCSPTSESDALSTPSPGGRCRKTPSASPTASSPSSPSSSSSGARLVPMSSSVVLSWRLGCFTFTAFSSFGFTSLSSTKASMTTGSAARAAVCTENLDVGGGGGESKTRPLDDLPGTDAENTFSSDSDVDTTATPGALSLTQAVSARKASKSASQSVSSFATPTFATNCLDQELSSSKRGNSQVPTEALRQKGGLRVLGTCAGKPTSSHDVLPCASTRQALTASSAGRLATAGSKSTAAKAAAAPASASCAAALLHRPCACNQVPTEGRRKKSRLLSWAALSGLPSSGLAEQPSSMDGEDLPAKLQEDCSKHGEAAGRRLVPHS